MGTLYTRRRPAGYRATVAVAAITLMTAAAWAEVTGTTRVGILPGAGSGASAVFATHAPGRPDELFVVDQRGLIQILNLTTGNFNSTPFLDIQSLVDDGGNEQGLLGLAFDPDYENNGYFYVNYTRGPGPGLDRTRIERYRVGRPTTSSSVSLTTASPVLEFDQDFSNHNAGWIGFSPIDGMLYIPTGDGGSGNDPNNRAQNLRSRLGKILRVDPSGDDFPNDLVENYRVPGDNPFVGDNDPNTLDEIFASGLRNPWRNSFDSATGDLWLGDVGQGAREEINLLPADREEVANFGWRLREGDIQTPGSVGGPIPDNYLGPVYDYFSNGAGLFGGNSVVGGYVYRGPDPEVYGRYFFGDSFPSQLWSFEPNDPDGTVQNLDSLLNPRGFIGTPVSYGEDAEGNLYLVDRDGEIYRINTDAERAPGDYDGNGLIDADDYVAWRDSFGSTLDLAADGNGDGVVDAADYTVWRDALVQADSTATPEPSALLIALVASSAIASSTRRPPAA